MADVLQLAGHSNSEQRSKSQKLWSIALVLAVVTQGFFITGFSIGFTSPVLADLSQAENERYASLRKPIHKDLFNLSLLVGATVAMLFSGYLTDKIGRKLSMVACSVIYTIGWLLIVLVVEFTDSPVFRILLFTGRFIVGISIGWTSLCVNLYVAEMSPENVRGGLLTVNQLSLNTGLFLGQLIGLFISYYWLALIPLALTVSFMVFSMTTNETPRWLISQGRVIEAKRVLIWLKGRNCNINQELNSLSDNTQPQQQLSLSEMCQELKSRSAYHPIILSCFAMLFLQISGIYAIVFNAENIFKQAHVKSPGLVASLSTGGVTVIFSVVGLLINDLIGRRKLLIISNIVASLSHGVMGAYEYVNTEPYCHPPSDPKCNDHLYPLAIVSIACFIASYSAGISAATFSLVSEIIPLRVRGIGTGLSMFVNWGFSALTAGLFSSYEALVRPWGAFWMFSVACLVSAIFVAIFVPETRKMSLEEIERHFTKKNQSKDMYQYDELSN